MILDVNNDPPSPCLIYDAAGEVIRHVIRCDTETGEVTRYLPKEGRPDCIVGPVAGVIPTVTDRHPAPLRVERVAG